MTATTDFLLALLALVWAVRLARRARGRGDDAANRRAVGLWSAAFGGIAVATAAAGVYHAVEATAPPAALAVLWNVVVVATSGSGLAMTCGAAFATSSPRRAIYAAAAVVVFCGFVLWGLADDDFLRVAMSTATALAAVLAFQAVSWFRDRAASAAWVAGGVAVSVGAVAVQRLRIGLGPAFDHNATYHALQAGGLFLLYRGGTRFDSGPGGPRGRPTGDWPWTDGAPRYHPELDQPQETPNLMTDASNDSEPAVNGGVFREWVLPIGVGLIIGAAAVLAWKHGRQFLQSDAEKLVQQWSWGDFEENDRLEAELKKLGKDARSDLLQAWRRMEVPADPDGEDEAKTWAAQILAGDPYFDTRSIVDVVRDPAAPAWDRRTGAAALTHTLHKDVDPTAVVEPLLTWLEDGGITDHLIGMTSVRQLRADNVFPPDQEERLRKALLKLVARAGRPEPVDEYAAIRIRTDRERAVRAVGSFLSHDDAKAAMWQIAGDEADDVHVRVAAVQTLAGNAQFTDPEPWKKIAASKDDTVRQCIAENLASCNVSGFDGILAGFHSDRAPLVRKGSIETQAQRNRPSMLPVMDALIEDSDPWVRREALIACGVFKEHLDGQGARKGMLLRVLETATEDSDIEGAILALNLITGQSYGFAAGDVDGPKRRASDAAIAAFKSDTGGRREALVKWRAHLGGDAVWTDGDRRKTLEKLLTHADPLNVERAKTELEKLAK